MELIGPGHIVVTQMAEFTEIIDTDQDGVADRYNNLASDFGISGNYHETNAICTDGERFLHRIGYGIAQWPHFLYSQGEYSKDGRRGEIFHQRLARMGCPLSQRRKAHTFLKRFPYTQWNHPFSDGEIWCGDNQGDWRGGSPIYRKARVFQWTSIEPRVGSRPRWFRHSYLPPKKDVG